MNPKWVCPHCGCERGIKAIRMNAMLIDYIPTPVTEEYPERDTPEIFNEVTAHYECSYCGEILPVNPPREGDGDVCLVDYLKNLPYNKEE